MLFCSVLDFTYLRSAETHQRPCLYDSSIRQRQPWVSLKLVFNLRFYTFLSLVHCRQHSLSLSTLSSRLIEKQITFVCDVSFFPVFFLLRPRKSHEAQRPSSCSSGLVSLQRGIRRAGRRRIRWGPLDERDRRGFVPRSSSLL